MARIVFAYSPNHIKEEDMILVDESCVQSICGDIFSAITIHPNGKVTACCGVMTRDYSLLDKGFTVTRQDLAVFGVDSIIDQLCKSKKAVFLRQYFGEMYAVIAEMQRVLKKGKATVIVVGTSHLRNMDVETRKGLAAIGESVWLGRNRRPPLGLRQTHDVSVLGDQTTHAD